LALANTTPAEARPQFEILFWKQRQGKKKKYGVVLYCCDPDGFS